MNFGEDGMKCEKCGQQMRPEEKVDHHGLVICEDCYMDALSPAKACDPWAVFCAKSIPENIGAKAELTVTQKEILRILEETGGATADRVAEELQLDRADLEREIATLRHMEKLRASLRQGEKIICLW